MKTILNLEELAQLVFAVFLHSLLPYEWYWFWVWFLSPDLGFIGYAINTRVGQWTYNLLHHKGIAISLYVAGLYFNQTELQFAGVVMFGHSAFDRMLGYGLKYADDFKHTHLGWIGKGRD